MKKSGDVSRRRRVKDPARQRHYAWFRSVRFARRMFQGPGRGVTVMCFEFHGSAQPLAE